MRRIRRVVLGLKQSVLELLPQLKESGLFVSVPVRHPIVLMPHFSCVYSHGFIPLICSLSRPLWLLSADIENLCRSLISRHLEGLFESLLFTRQESETFTPFLAFVAAQIFLRKRWLCVDIIVYLSVNQSTAVNVVICWYVRVLWIDIFVMFELVQIFNSIYKYCPYKNTLISLIMS